MPRVFISYSHDSPAHVDAVRVLSDRLREEGIDCHIDQYEMFPAQGWPRWMREQIAGADFVLVVGSTEYLKRVRGNEKVGVGAGAKWEGAIITQDLYDAEGKNEKFIPVVIRADDVSSIPPFLRGYTRYEVETQAGYDALYRLVTGQPKVNKPALGQIRKLPASRGIEQSVAPTPALAREDHDFSSLVLLFAQDLGMHFVDSESISIEQEVTLTLAPFNREGGAFLSTLQKHDKPLRIAYDLSSISGRVRAVKKTLSKGQENYELKLIPDESDYAPAFMEMSTQGHSADQIAEMRARRILLNETLGSSNTEFLSRMNETTMEVFVRGLNAPLAVRDSPLPGLYEEIGASDPSYFVAAARLVSVLWLRLSGTVETVLQLSLQLRDRSLAVDFVGIRAKKYINAEAYRIAVKGICPL